MSVRFLKRENLPDLAYARTEGEGRLPGVLFCGGFRSDMEGTKALWLEQCCAARKQGFVRFDYTGHGRSGGAFEDGTIGIWTKDALDALDALTEGPVIVAGSSMGGWIALNLALRRPAKIAGILGMAAAPDFTRDIESALAPEQRAALARDGRIMAPCDYADEPYLITARLLREGESHCLLDKPLPLGAPITLIHGREDRDVPWRAAHRIREAMTDPALAEIVILEGAGHRLSRPEDLGVVDARLRALSGL